MVDMTMCNDDACPSKNTCRRYMARPNLYGQAYGRFVRGPLNRKCTEFIFNSPPGPPGLPDLVEIRGPRRVHYMVADAKSPEPISNDKDRVEKAEITIETIGPYHENGPVFCACAWFEMCPWSERDPREGAYRPGKRCPGQGTYTLEEME